MTEEAASRILRVVKHDLRHCDDPGCTTGTILGTCRRCGAKNVNNQEECVNWIPFRPLYDQIVVKRDAPPEKIGLIHVPEVVQERLQAEVTEGVVVAVGPGRYRMVRVKHKVTGAVISGGETRGYCERCCVVLVSPDEDCGKLADTRDREPVDVAVGDLVFFHPKAGTAEITLGDVKYTVMWDDEVLAVGEAEKAAE